MNTTATNPDSPAVEPPAQSMAAARAAGLRYVTDAMPGIRRRRAGKGFRYVDSSGKGVADAETLVRIRALVIPPAWTDVWICALDHGHLQVTARDARGRKQYRYHERWREVRDETKYDRLADFGRALPDIRARVVADLGLPGLPRAKVLASVVRLMESTFIRVGNEKYVRDNGSFGATTLRNEHVLVRGDEIRLSFRGKSGKQHRVALTDGRLARIIRRCRELPGYELFQYLDENGEQHSIDAADVNDYLRAAAGDTYTAKDFRTWSGTVLAATALDHCGASASTTEAKRNVVRAIQAVAGMLGNTAAVCRKCYVHPSVIEAYAAGTLARAMRARSGRALSAGVLRPEESAVLRLLQRRALPTRTGAARRPQRQRRPAPAGGLAHRGAAAQP